MILTDDATKELNSYELILSMIFLANILETKKIADTINDV
jgi:hypothetical protein